MRVLHSSDAETKCDVTHVKAFGVFPRFRNVNDEMVPVGKALKGKLSGLMRSTCGGKHAEGSRG